MSSVFASLPEMPTLSDLQPYLVGAVLFVVLAPGLILSLPATSSEECKNIAPFPTNATDDDKQCKGDKSDGLPAFDPICKAQNRCHKVFISKTVTVGTVFLHALIFVVLLYVIDMYGLPLIQRSAGY
jgi:hypothetical protein